MKALLSKLRNDGHITNQQYEQLKTAFYESYAFNEALKELMLKNYECKDRKTALKAGLSEAVTVMKKWLRKAEIRSE